MAWIEYESVWFVSPAFADEFVRCEALECLEPSSEVVGVDEVTEMLPELVVTVVVEASNGSVLDGSVHPLYLPVGPGMVGLGQAVFDIVGAADIAERVTHKACGWRCAPRPLRFLGSGANWMPLSVRIVWMR